MKPSRMRAATFAALAAATVGLVSCGGGGGGSDASPGAGGGGAATTTSAATFGSSNGSKGATGSAHGKVRVVNVFLRDDKAFGPLDLYDVPNPAADAKPLIEGLGYGEVSDYVGPRSISDRGNLYVFPAGSTTRDDEKFGGQGISNAGWNDGEQSTVVIGAAPALTTGDPTNLQYSEIPETDDSATWKPIAGKGAILANHSGAGVDARAASVTLVVDDECPMRIDPENSPGGGQGLDQLANGNAVTYEVAPGSHDVALLAAAYDSAVSACTAADAFAQATVDVDAGGRMEVFVYGTSPTDLKVVTAPVDEP